MIYKGKYSNIQQCYHCGELIVLEPQYDRCICYKCLKQVWNHTKGHFIYKLDKMIKEVNKQMNKDNYSEVINGEDTYKECANYLKEGKTVFIGWTDNDATHYDILLSYGNCITEGCHQRGLKGNELFISIIGIGSAGFNINNGYKAPGYVAEKLFNGRYDSTVDKIAELINGIGDFLCEK